MYRPGQFLVPSRNLFLPKIWSFSLKNQIYFTAMIIGESLTFCFRSELISSLPLPLSGFLFWFLAFRKFMVPKYWKRLDQGNRFWHNMTCPYLQIIFMVLLWPIRSHFSLNQIIKVWKIGWSNGRQSERLDTSRPLRPAYPILSCLAMVYGSVFCRHLLWPLILAHPEVVYVIFKR